MHMTECVCAVLLQVCVSVTWLITAADNIVTDVTYHISDAANSHAKCTIVIISSFIW